MLRIAPNRLRTAWAAAAAWVASAAPALAQEDALAEGQSSGGGDPIVGYFVFGLFAGLAIFMVCKSARRG
jgi:hypothetical protein